VELVSAIIAGARRLWGNFAPRGLPRRLAALARAYGLDRIDLGRAVLVAALFTFIVLAVGHLLRRKWRHRKSAKALREATERGAGIPLTLHPVIDPDICIGSLTCLKSCPEGDILGIVNGAARLIHADHCIGHGKCAAECPVDAIKLVFGTKERGVDLPMVDEYFESSRGGVHIIGELGGMGLIKNAVTQGVQVGERLARTMPPRNGSTPDVVIVGAGPAGLAAALRLREAGRSFRVLDQGSLGGTIANYPRQKVVMTEPFQVPYFGKVAKKLISKEELLSIWERALQKSGVRIEEGVKVTGIEGRDGGFRVQTNRGAVDGRKVVLATGLRGTPRKLGVRGEDLPKVTYRLADAEQYDGCDVLVVGGGDSALEAAMQLAEQSDARVSISYRGDSFNKCRDANRNKLAGLVKARRVRAVLSSEVDVITETEVVLTVAGSPQVLKNDFVIVNIGGELPVEFLAKLQISLEKHFEEERKKPKHAGAGKRRGLAREQDEQSSRRRTHLFYFLTGALILAWLTIKGWSYYPLSHAARMTSPLHATLRPAGRWGHGVGIVATAFMMLNFLYPVRKRSNLLAGKGSIRGWLDFHMFVGFMSPLVIAFHSAFQSNNQLATGTAAALLVVVLTGVIGRFIYGLVPSAGGKALAVSEVLGRWEALRARMQPMLDEADNPALLHRLFDSAAKAVKPGSLLWMFVTWPLRSAWTRLRLFIAGFYFDDPDAWDEFRDGYLQLSRLRMQVTFYQSLKNLLGVWRVFHASLAGFLVIAIAAHIAVSVYLGYVFFR
jgi:thioredoxin reductase/Pyruvate/2-oxoacid:ferredoxin oxidoreductase delta subunit